MIPAFEKKPKKAKIDYEQFAKHADISPCKKYRYLLHRKLSDKKGKVLIFIMLNPSTASGLDNDNTIRRCMYFGLREGASDIYVVNLFAYRTPYIWKLCDEYKNGVDIIGPETDGFIDDLMKEFTSCGREVVLVAAWGSTKNWKGGGAVNLIAARSAQIYGKYGSRMVCFKTNADGSPVHPLYQADDTALKPYKMKIQGELIPIFKPKGKLIQTRGVS